MSFHRAVADEEHGWQENRPDGGSLSKNVLPNCRVFFLFLKALKMEQPLTKLHHLWIYKELGPKGKQ